MVEHYPSGLRPVLHFNLPLQEGECKGSAVHLPKTAMASLSMDMPGGHGADRSTGRGQNCSGVVGQEVEEWDRAVTQHDCHHFP